MSPGEALYLVKQLNGFNPKSRMYFQTRFDIPQARMRYVKAEIKYTMSFREFVYKPRSLVHLVDVALNLFTYRTRAVDFQVYLCTLNRVKPGGNRLKKMLLPIKENHFNVIQSIPYAFDYTRLLPLMCPLTTKWLTFDGWEESWQTGEQLQKTFSYENLSLPVIRAVKVGARCLQISTDSKQLDLSAAPYVAFRSEMQERQEYHQFFGHYGRPEKLPSFQKALEKLG